MNRPLVASLLAGWCAFAVAPAWIVYFTFRGVDADTPIIGPIIVIWIAGYLVQFILFMAVTRKARGNSIVGWLMASTMPFVADWSVPVAPWSPAAVGVVLATYAGWFYTRLTRSDDLQQNGIPATGTVIAVKEPIMNMIINSVYLRRTVMLRIERADGTPPYEARYAGTFMLGDLPSVGDVFPLRVDATDPLHFETSDETSRAASPLDEPAVSTQTDPTIAEQLQQLDDLHRRGALTDDEFAAAKARVLLR